MNQSTKTRFVKFTFSCPKRHTNVREEMVFAETESDAEKHISLMELRCDQCGAVLDKGSAVRVVINRVMSDANKKSSTSES